MDSGERRGARSARRARRAGLLLAGLLPALLSLPAGPVQASDEGLQVTAFFGGGGDPGPGGTIDLGYADVRSRPAVSPSVRVSAASGTTARVEAVRLLEGPGRVLELPDAPCTGTTLRFPGCFFRVAEADDVERGRRTALVEVAYRSPASSSTLRTLQRRLVWTLADVPARPSVSVEPGPAAGQVTVAVTAPDDDGGAPLADVDVLGQMDDDAAPALYDRVAPRVPGPTRVVLSGLVEGRRVEVFAAVRNAVGSSALSDGVRTVVPGLASSPDPVHVRRPPASPITISWSVPRNDGGAPVLHYEVHRYREGEAQEVLIGRTSGMSWQDSPGLLATDTITYRVRAVTRYGPSAFSSPVRAPLVSLG